VTIFPPTIYLHKSSKIEATLIATPSITHLLEISIMELNIELNIARYLF
jgi:hypothetical protein